MFPAREPDVRYFCFSWSIKNDPTKLRIIFWVCCKVSRDIFGWKLIFAQGIYQKCVTFQAMEEFYQIAWHKPKRGVDRKKGVFIPPGPLLGPGPFTLLSSASRVAHFVLKAPNVACQVKIHYNYLNIFSHYLAKVLIRECQLLTRNFSVRLLLHYINYTSAIRQLTRSLKSCSLWQITRLRDVLKVFLFYSRLGVTVH